MISVIAHFRTLGQEAMNRTPQFRDEGYLATLPLELPAMRAKQRTEREVSRAIRLGRAKRGVEELRRTALAAEQEFSAEFELGPIDIQD